MHQRGRVFDPTGRVGQVDVTRHDGEGGVHRALRRVQPGGEDDAEFVVVDLVVDVGADVQARPVAIERDFGDDGQGHELAGAALAVGGEAGGDAQDALDAEGGQAGARCHETDSGGLAGSGEGLAMGGGAV